MDSLEILKKHDLKLTRHRLFVLNQFLLENRLFSADDLYLLMKEEDLTVSLSTIYRILESFSSHGLIKSVTITNEQQVYYKLHNKHHAHHLICKKCHKVIPINGCPIHPLEKSLKQEMEFQIEEHILEFYGICKECQ